MRRTAKSIAIVLAAVMIFTMFPLTASAASNKPGKVKIKSFKVSSVSTFSNTATVTIKWKKASKATGYWVYERQPDGSWKLLKKLGKRYAGIRIYSVYAGQRAFKVRAVRKVKKKTYKGSFSAVKSKFIASPLTLEQLSRIEGEPTEETGANALGTLKTSIKGNNIKMIQYAGSLNSEDINKFFTDLDKNKLIELCRTARLDGGITGVTVTVVLNCNGSDVRTETYHE
ncbi:MAG: hypothetical protein IJJ03_10185 [Mogibacterium sp.]|nr:hypothetical protein [Mogibacterium sp.]MBQ6501785.1 hypothetical protein [Mogibacterium sp.]